MSAFGDGTFKQRVLEFIRDEVHSEQVPLANLMPDIIDVVRYLADQAYWQTLNDMKKEAREAVRQELIEKLEDKS